MEEDFIRMAAMAALEERFESVFQMLVPINGLSPQRQQQLLAQAVALEFGPREFVFREGDRNNYAFFCWKGGSNYWLKASW